MCHLLLSFPQIPFIFIVLGHTINALLSQKFSSSKGFGISRRDSANRNCSSYCSWQAVLHTFKALKKLWIPVGKYILNFCARKHSAVVLKLTKARRFRGGRKALWLWPCNGGRDGLGMYQINRVKFCYDGFQGPPLDKRQTCMKGKIVASGKQSIT